MRYRALTLVVAATFALAACGDDGTDDGAGDSAGEATEAVSGSGGWVDGEPAWSNSGGDEEAPAAAGDVATAEADSASPEAGAESADRDAAEPMPPGEGPERPANDQPLSAGSVDDNEDFGAYLDYLERIRSLDIPTRAFDPTGRIVVTATGSSGQPVAGAEVVVSAAGEEVTRIRTAADGTARFHPSLYGAGDTGSFDFTAEGVVATAEPGGTATLELPSAGGAEAPVPLDVLFLLDATGSMGDEIDRLKTNIDSIAARVDELESAPDVRFGMTLYRDVSDAFVTSTYDFTGNVEEFRGALAEVVADGGNDYPEALDEGLAEALGKPSWRDPASTVQLVFLVADAPPHVERDVPTPYPDSISDAIGRGVKIFPVASSESDDQAEAVFRQLAQSTGARFVFLSYGAEGAATGSETDIDRTDYEELPLDELVVRLITEELAALTGDDTPPPPPPDTTPPTTNPPGQ